MRYEIVIKGDRLFMLYLPSSYCSGYCSTAPKTAAPGTGTGAPQMDQRLLTNTWPKQCTKISIQQTLTKTKKQYINTIKQQEKLSLNCSTRYNDRVDIKNAKNGAKTHFLG